jgi:sugar lactone lactonase YvrE
MKQFKLAFSCALACLTVAFGAVQGAFAQQDVVTTFAGGGPNGIPAVNANLNEPNGMAIDLQGNIYIAGFPQNRIYKITPSGIITVVAGSGVRGYSGDGGLAIAANLNQPQGVAVDGANPANIYISDSANCLIRKVTASTGIITTIAGLVTKPTSGAPYATCGYSGDGAAADAAKINAPETLALNPATNDLYFADYNNGRVRKVAGGTPTGIITTIAGGGGSTTATNNCQGSAPYGDGAAANQSYLCQPVGVVLDTKVSPVNIFITDSSRCAVREVIGSSGKIYQVAGTYGACGFVDNVAATSARLYYPYQLQVQSTGTTETVTVADLDNYRIRQFPVTVTGGVPTSGTITTIAGDGSGYSGDGGPATKGGMTQPWGIVFDAAGDYYVSEQGSDRVRKVTKSTGFLSTIAGWGPNAAGQINYSDPVGITADPGTGIALYQSTAVYADPRSTLLYIGGYSSQAVYSIDSSTGKVSNFAGNGIAGFAGDGTVATTLGVQLSNPSGSVKDASGDVYIADFSNCVVRKVTAGTGVISTVAGTPGRCGFSGDGGAALSAEMYGPSALAIDSANNLYIADYYNCSIRRVDGSSQIITTYAGIDACGYNGDNLPATSAKLNYPNGVAIDGQGNLFIADQNNHRIRKVDANFGFITTVAGDGVGGYTKDGFATAVSLNTPQGVTADPNGNIFISDTYNDILRWVDPAGNLITFAGTPDVNGFSGDGGPATSAMFYYPVGITQDNTGNFYTADYNNDRVRKISAFAGYGRSTNELQFAKQGIGTTSEFQPVILSAIGPITISNIAVTAGFTEYDDCTGYALVAGETCEVDVYFSPSKVGETKGTLTISSDAFAFSTPQANTVNLAGLGDGISVSGSLAFGSQTLHTTTAQTITINNSGSAVTLKPITLASTGQFTITGGTCPVGGGLLAANSSCTVSVSFTPTAIGAAQNTLRVLSTDSVSPLLVPITGNGIGFTISPGSLTFASTTAGTSETLNLTITNVSTVAITLATSITGTGAAEFVVGTTGNTCGTSVAAGKSCVLPVQFKAAAAGAFSASLNLTTNGGTNPTISLTGTATASVTYTPTALSFGPVVENASSILNVTVGNTGSSPLTVAAAISGTNASAFKVLTTTANTCQTAVPAGKTCTLPVQFTPTAIANFTATLTLTTSGGSNPVIPLTGSGTAPVVATPTTLAFGTISVGTTSTLSVTITNNGASTIGIGSSISTSAPFTELFTSANTCLSGLAPTASCTLPVQFAPTTATASSATLTINAGATTLTVSLTGTGK